MIRALFAVLFCLVVTACTITDITNTMFDGKAVPKKEPVSYTCIGATEYFEGFKPQMEQMQIWPFNVTVVDEGSNWQATFPNGRLESPQLYYGDSARVVGGSDPDGHRWYRIDSPRLMFTHSKLSSSGDGEGVTFFHCK